MKVLVQRSKNSSVIVNRKIVGAIDFGVVLLVSFTHTDNKEIIDKMVQKVIQLRIFDDLEGVMNKSLLDVKGSALSISQFTLYADTKKGNRPSYKNSLGSSEARELYDYFNKELKKYVRVETGIFQEHMEVNIVNDGPVTIMLER